MEWDRQTRSAQPASYNSIHPVVSNEEAVMADTRLKAVATAESPRTLFAGARESAAAGCPVGHSGCGVIAAAAGFMAGSPRRAQRDLTDPVSFCPVFAHTFSPSRPSSVRAGTRLCVGLARQRRLLRIGVSCRRHAQAPRARRADAPQVRVAHAMSQAAKARTAIFPTSKPAEAQARHAIGHEGLLSGNLCSHRPGPHRPLWAASMFRWGGRSKHANRRRAFRRLLPHDRVSGFFKQEF